VYFEGPPLKIGPPTANGSHLHFACKSVCDMNQMESSDY